MASSQSEDKSTTIASPLPGYLRPTAAQRKRAQLTKPFAPSPLRGVKFGAGNALNKFSGSPPRNGPQTLHKNHRVGTDHGTDIAPPKQSPHTLHEKIRRSSFGGHNVDVTFSSNKSNDKKPNSLRHMVVLGRNCSAVSHQKEAARFSKESRVSKYPDTGLCRPSIQMDRFFVPASRPGEENSPLLVPNMEFDQVESNRNVLYDSSDEFVFVSDRGANLTGTIHPQSSDPDHIEDIDMFPSPRTVPMQVPGAEQRENVALPDPTIAPLRDPWEAIVEKEVSPLPTTSNPTCATSNERGEDIDIGPSSGTIPGRQSRAAIGRNNAAAPLNGSGSTHVPSPYNMEAYVAQTPGNPNLTQRWGFENLDDVIAPVPTNTPQRQPSRAHSRDDLDFRSPQRLDAFNIHNTIRTLTTAFTSFDERSADIVESLSKENDANRLRIRELEQENDRLQLSAQEAAQSIQAHWNVIRTLQNQLASSMSTPSLRSTHEEAGRGDGAIPPELQKLAENVRPEVVERLGRLEDFLEEELESRFAQSTSWDRFEYDHRDVRW